MRKFTIILILLGSIVFLSDEIKADDANVLPHGRFRVRTKLIYSFYDTLFNPDGKEEPIGTDYDKVNVNKSVFPSLVGSLTLGTTSFDSSVESFILPIYAEYGFMDNISIGIVVPVLHVHRDVRFSIQGGNVGFDSNGNIQPVGGGVKPVDTEGVQSILQSPVYGYQFKRIEDFSNTGIGDIRFGFKHQYLKKTPVRLAYTMSLRLPTGESDDPDNLLDIALGDGQSDIVFESQNDYLPIDNTLLNFYIRYTIQLPDKQAKRLQTSANEPIAPIANKEMVERDLGDVIEVEITSSYTFWGSFNAGLQYRFMYKGGDKIESPIGRDTRGLSAETQQRSHQAGFGIGYSTMQSFQKGQFFLPMEIVADYQEIIDGINVQKARSVGLEMRVYF